MVVITGSMEPQPYPERMCYGSAVRVRFEGGFVDGGVVVKWWMRSFRQRTWACQDLAVAAFRV